LELGYALGQGKKMILTAMEGTILPFDAEMIPCYFWSSKKSIEDNQKNFTEFMKKNIIRQPIVGHITLTKF